MSQRTLSLAAGLLVLALLPIASAQAQIVYSGRGIGASVTNGGTTTFADSGALNPSGAPPLSSSAAFGNVGTVFNATGLFGATSSTPSQAIGNASAQTVSLLGGLITAASVQSSATAKLPPATVGTSTFNNLVIFGGAPINGSVGANTSGSFNDGVNVGTYILNETNSVVGPTSASIDVTALDVNVTSGPYAGNHITVAFSHADISSPSGQPVPEPSSVLLFGIAFLGLTGYRMWRRKTSLAATA